MARSLGIARRGDRFAYDRPEDRLPSRAQIGQECGVGENVVRRAQELLISQGMLEGRAGSGTYVAEGDLCVRTTYEFLGDGRPLQLSTSWEPYDLTACTLVVLPEGGPHAGAGVVNRMAAVGITVSHAVEQRRPVETADIVVPAAHCEIVYEIPVNRWQDSSASRP